MTININMVARLEVVGNMCPQHYPCSHRVKITLADGRKANEYLRMWEIYALVEAISKEKLVSTWDNSHFKMDLYRLAFHTMGTVTTYPTANQVLIKIFHEMTLEEDSSMDSTLSSK